MLRPVFKCHGGKFYLREWIISLLPKTYIEITYVECCGGGASILLNKDKSRVEIYNDLDPGINAIFAELSMNSKEFIERVKTIQYNEETFLWAKEQLEKSNIDAVAELIVRRFSRGGMRKSFSWSNRLRGGRPGDENSWETFKSQLPQLAERLKDVIIKKDDVVDLCLQYSDPSVAIYIDPPYLHSTRKSKNVYDLEMTDEQHKTMLSVAVESKAKVMISGYDSPLYRKMLKGWKMHCKPMPNHSSQAKNKELRIECVWLNY